jgi:hypothetical protein
MEESVIKHKIVKALWELPQDKITTSFGVCFIDPMSDDRIFELGYRACLRDMQEEPVPPCVFRKFD